jgi:hypothetical protein
MSPIVPPSPAKVLIKFLKIHYRELVWVLNKYPLEDEKLKYTLYYLDFLYLGEETKAKNSSIWFSKIPPTKGKPRRL